MKRWLLKSVMLLALSAGLLRADYISVPLDAALTQQSPYKYAGIIFSIWDATTGAGELFYHHALSRAGKRVIGRNCQPQWGGARHDQNCRPQ